MDILGAIALASGHEGLRARKLLQGIGADGNPRLGQDLTLTAVRGIPAVFAAQLERRSIGQMKSLGIRTDQVIAIDPLPAVIAHVGSKAAGIDVSQQAQRRLKERIRFFAKACLMLVVFMAIETDLTHRHIFAQRFAHAGR